MSYNLSDSEQIQRSPPLIRLIDPVLRHSRNRGGGRGQENKQRGITLIVVADKSIVDSLYVLNAPLISSFL